MHAVSGKCLSHNMAPGLESNWQQVFLDGKCLGGASDLHELQESGKLVQLLAKQDLPALPTALRDAVEASQADREVLTSPTGLLSPTIGLFSKCHGVNVLNLLMWNVFALHPHNLLVELALPVKTSCLWPD